MLKSCSYCGRIHERSFACNEKNESVKKRQRKTSDMENKFRWSRRWKNKAEDIKKRDVYLCQLCIRGLHGEKTINATELSVHHIIGIREDYDRRLDNDNLITLCRMHHELADSGRITKRELLVVAKEQEEDSLKK